MRNQLLALALGFMTVMSFAQKKELKSAEKAIKNQDYAAASSAIDAAKALNADTDSKLKTKFFFLKGQTFEGKKEYKAAADSYNKLLALEKEAKRFKYTNKSQAALGKIISVVSNRGIKYFDAKDFKNATKDLHLTFVLSPADTLYLYYAAISASQGKDYDISLKHYRKLVEIGYNGSTTSYIATSSETEKEETFGNKIMRDLAVRSESHKNPLDKKSKSKKIGIIKDMAFILSKQGKIEEAVLAIKEARKHDPKDLNLLLTEADFYIGLNKMDEFAKLMKEAVLQDPDNPTLYFNLGVVHFNQKKMAEAKEYYLKAISLDSEYNDAYMNVAVLILDENESIVDEMNTNPSNKRYSELEKKQLSVFREAMPYLEKADSLKRTIDTVRTLLNIYDNLEMDEKATVYRALFKKMRE
ncbi:MAG: tetratricopeptide repeat protein [Flavobacteriaceae bacterium]|nr:tetratricopeptide repeat protein [Flavobacteriaceae bacterium]